MLSTGDWIALGGVGVAGVAFAGRELRLWRSDGTKAAGQNATVNVQIAGFQKAFDSIVTSLQQLDSRQDHHELDCAAFRATAEQIMQNNAKTNENLAESVKNLNAQVSRLVPADAFVEVRSRK